MSGKRQTQTLHAFIMREAAAVGRLKHSDLTAGQRLVLKRLAVGPYYPTGPRLASARALVRKELADWDRSILCFRITPAGRAALAHEGRD